MPLTWKQKKAIIAEYVKDNHYVAPLKEKGFVSYRDEGLCWYKIKNDLLYSVRMVLFAGREPLELVVGVGALPLFSWEYIVRGNCYRDWGGIDYSVLGFYFDRAIWMASRAISNHFIETLTMEDLEAYRDGATLKPYKGTYITEWGSKDGEELIENLVFPVLDKLNSIEKLYEFNKKARIIDHCDGYNQSIKKGKAPVIDEDDVLKSDFFGLGSWKMLSLTFAEQCLYCGDVKWYPTVMDYLKEYQAFEYMYYEFAGKKFNPYAPKTKRESVGLAENQEHARVLIRAMETGDRVLMKEEFERNRERMMKQIREQLPNIRIEND